MKLIYHMLPASQWQALPEGSDYRAESLTTEGFIHCTGEPERLVKVANQFYRDEPGNFVILSLDVVLIQADVRWEEADNHLFPHIYGPINRKAIVAVTPFPRTADGAFQAPSFKQHLSSTIR